MTDKPRLSIHRRWAHLLLAAAVVVYGVVGFPALPGSDVNYAIAQDECDAECWAILKYLTEQGLSQQDIIDLGNSGIEPDPDTPDFTPDPEPEPEPPASDPDPEPEPEPPVSDPDPGTSQPSCQYGGVWPNCEPATPSTVTNQTCWELGLGGAQCQTLQGKKVSGTGCDIYSTSEFCERFIGYETRKLASELGLIDPPPLPACYNSIHTDNCEKLVNVGINEDLLDGQAANPTSFDEARQLAQSVCGKSLIVCDWGEMNEAWQQATKDIEHNDQNIDRGTQAWVMCRAYGGGRHCSKSTPEERQSMIQWMCSNKYTTTFVEDGCSASPDQVLSNFGWTDPMTHGQSWTFNARVLRKVGYTPPFGHSTPAVPPPDSPCINGMTLMSAHVADDDNGCRPPRCDFGRAADGWCSPPASTEPPIVHIDGEAVNEYAGSATFRLALSHATSQKVSVTVSTSDGTATAGSDYSAVNQRVTFGSRATTDEVTVPIFNDRIYEPDETFMLSLSSPSSNAELSTDPQAEATIVNDDERPYGTPGNVRVDCSVKNDAFEITGSWGPVSGASSYIYQIHYEEYDPANLYGPTLVGGKRITRVRGILTRTFVARSDNTSDFRYGHSGAGVYIVLIWAANNAGSNFTEVPAEVSVQCLPDVGFVATEMTVDEGESIHVEATLNASPADTASVRFNTSGASPSVSFTSCSQGAKFYVSGTEFTFTATTSASITLHACDDIDAFDETVTLTLTTTGISGLNLGSSTAVVLTIQDDETAPEFLS